MRSGTSFFNGTLFKKTVTRFWPIWASYLVMWLIILPVDLLVNRSLGYTGDVYMSLSTMQVSAVFFGLFAAMAVMSHLYSPRSANFFGALPVRREGQFITQYLAGLSFLVVPDVIVAGLTALVLAVNGNLSMTGVLSWLAVAVGEGFFFYTFAVLCGMFVGHILALPVFYVIFNFIAVFIKYLLSEIVRVFYYGFAGFSESVEGTIQWFSPALKFSEIVNYQFENGGQVEYRLTGLPIVGVYAVVAAVLALAAFFLYKRRRIESAGDVVAIRALKPVFKYGVAVCAGLTLGYVTSLILGEGALPYTIVAWSVIGCFAAQMILDKSFRVFRKWHGAAVTGAVMAAVLIVMALDFTGYETRIPDVEDVKSVEIEVLNSSFDGDDGAAAPFTVTDRNQIEKLMALHRAAIEQRDGPESGDWDRDWLNFRINYRTKTGHIRRGYELTVDAGDVNTPGSVAASLENVFADRDLYWHVYGFDTLEEDLAAGGRIASISYYFSIYDVYAVDDLSDPSVNGGSVLPETEFGYFQHSNILDFVNADAVSAIYDAVKADFASGAIGHYSVADRSGGSGALDCRRQLTINWITPGGETRDLSITVLDESEKTLETVWQLLPGTLEEQGLLDY